MKDTESLIRAPQRERAYSSPLRDRIEAAEYEPRRECAYRLANDSDALL